MRDSSLPRVGDRQRQRGGERGGGDRREGGERGEGRVVKGGESAMRDSSLPTVGDRQRQWGERGLERGAEGKRRCTEGGMMGLGVGGWGC